MAPLRRALRVLATAWLCGQVVCLSATPAALCLEAARNMAATACTCANGVDHASCPMHHSTSTKPRSKSECSCRGAADPDTAVLVAIIGPTAVMPGEIALDTLRSASTLAPESTPYLPGPILVPDGPPPRF